MLRYCSTLSKDGQNFYEEQAKNNKKNKKNKKQHPLAVMPSLNVNGTCRGSVNGVAKGGILTIKTMDCFCFEQFFLFLLLGYTWHMACMHT